MQSKRHRKRIKDFKRREAARAAKRMDKGKNIPHGSSTTSDIEQMKQIEKAMLRQRQQEEAAKRVAQQIEAMRNAVHASTFGSIIGELVCAHWKEGTEVEISKTAYEQAFEESYRASVNFLLLSGMGETMEKLGMLERAPEHPPKPDQSSEETEKTSGESLSEGS